MNLILIFLIYILIWFGLRKLKEKKYPRFKDLKRSKFGLILQSLLGGALFGFAGAYKITKYPNVDWNIFLIGWLTVCLVLSEFMDYLLIKGWANWLLYKEEKV
jgi:hypothetical protein